MAITPANMAVKMAVPLAVMDGAGNPCGPDWETHSEGEKETAMDGGWQDRIDCELRTLRRAETREQLSMEDQLLRAGHLEQQAVSGQPVQGAQVQYCRSTRSRILGGWWRTCCASLGAVLLAVAAGAGRRTSASSALKTAHRLVPEQMQPEGAHHDTAGQ